MRSIYAAMIVVSGFNAYNLYNVENYQLMGLSILIGGYFVVRYLDVLKEESKDER